MFPFRRDRPKGAFPFTARGATATSRTVIFARFTVFPRQGMKLLQLLPYVSKAPAKAPSEE